MRIGKIASSAGYRMDGQFQNCQFLEPNFDFPNWKIFNCDNFKNFQCGKFDKFAISKILKFSQILQFQKSSIF